MNGYPLQTGQLSDQLNPLSQDTKMPTSLGFLNSRHPVNIKKDHHLGRHDRWDKGHQHQREVLWQYLAAKERQQSSQRTSGIVLMAALTLFSGLMITTVFTNEAVLLWLESKQERVK